MIQLLVKDLKTKSNKKILYASLEKAKEKLVKIGPKNSPLKPKQKEILLGASFEFDEEKALLEPYLFPEKEKSKRG